MASAFAVSFIILVCGFVLVLGDMELRLAMVVILLANILSAIVFWLGGASWVHWPKGVFLVDTLALAALTLLALRSKRFWPLPVAALMVLPVATPLVTLVGQNLLSDALGYTQGLWSYVQCLILVLATLRQRKRMKEAAF